MLLLEQTVDFFKKCFPNPVSKNLHTQMGVHLEENSELLASLGSNSDLGDILLSEAKTALTALGNFLKKEDNVIFIKDRKEFLDGCCDVYVTSIGNAHMAGMSIVGAISEVNASNESKMDAFGDPIFDPNGKVIKGPNYRKPELDPFI